MIVTHDEPRALSKEEFAVAIKKSTRTVDRMILAGLVGTTQIGRSVFIPASELERLLKPTFSTPTM